MAVRNSYSIISILTVSALVVAGCGQSDDEVTVESSPTSENYSSQVDDEDADALAESLCSSSGMELADEYDPGSELVVSHPTDGQAFQEWENTRHQESGGPVGAADLRTEDADEFLALCYFDGEYESFPRGPEPEDGSVREPHTRLLATVTEEGDSELYQVGPAENLDTTARPTDHAD